MTGGRANGRAPDHGTGMNSSAEKASRKWANGAFGRTAAMVTAAAVLLWLGAGVGPAAAARRPVPAPRDLFGSGPVQPRGTVPRPALPPPPPPPAPGTPSG